MQGIISGAIIRLHGPLNLRVWDSLTMVTGFIFMALSIVFAMHGEPRDAAASAIGGLAICVECARQRRKHDREVWLLASESEDPIAALALYEYLYRVSFRDLIVLAQWRREREAAGLPVLCDDDLNTPPQVRAACSFLRSHPCEA